jgi:FADH2 O2-dependent halogenase
MTTPVYDVAILGSGMAGSMLSAVLARNGVKVLLLDAGIHPRFAVGESTIPYTSALVKIIAERYQVPELHALENYKGIVENISPMCGQKRNFGFVYHKEGQPHDPSQINEIVLPESELRRETHLFRQDVDAYLYYLAISYGTEPRTGTRVTDIDFHPGKGVRLKTDQGESFYAKYLVDGSGYRSPVAQKFGLRDQPTRARHHSRSMFTHMIGVTPFDDAAAAQGHTQPSDWHHGTLHHVFDGGWLWVIPFDNHDRSRSPLCSVGLTLDERVFPASDLTPGQEFDNFLERFPEIAEQFRGAKAVRPWVSTGERMQYSSTRTVGDRYCLTAHAAGFIDALYSRGLTNTAEVVNALAARLIDASRDDDWSTERFEYIERLQQGLFDIHDDLAYSSFVSFRDYELWNAVERVWESTNYLPWQVLERAYARYVETRDEQILRDLDNREVAGLPDPVGREIAALVTYTRETCQAVEAGELATDEAAKRIFAALRQAEWLPEPWERAAPDNKFFAASPKLFSLAEEWGRTKAPAHVAQLFG